MNAEELELNNTPTIMNNANKIIGPGSRLRHIREAKHIGIQEITNRLRINIERLTQLENDDYHQMGAATFAKGYLRAYATQLNLAKEEIIDILQTFDDLNLSANIKRHAPELIHEKIDPSTPKTTRWIGYLIVMILLSLLGYSYYQHFSGSNKTTGNSENAAMQPVTDPNAANIAPTNMPMVTSVPTTTINPQSPATSDTAISIPNHTISKNSRSTSNT